MANVKFLGSKVKPAATDKSDLGLMLFSRSVDLNHQSRNQNFDVLLFFFWGGGGLQKADESRCPDASKWLLVSILDDLKTVHIHLISPTKTAGEDGYQLKKHCAPSPKARFEQSRGAPLCMEIS